MLIGDGINQRCAVMPKVFQLGRHRFIKWYPIEFLFVKVSTNAIELVLWKYITTL